MLFGEEKKYDSRNDAIGGRITAVKDGTYTLEAYFNWHGRLMWAYLISEKELELCGKILRGFDAREKLDDNELELAAKLIEGKVLRKDREKLLLNVLVFSEEQLSDLTALKSTFEPVFTGMQLLFRDIQSVIEKIAPAKLKHHAPIIARMKMYDTFWYIIEKLMCEGVLQAQKDPSNPDIRCMYLLQK